MKRRFYFWGLLLLLNLPPVAAQEGLQISPQAADHDLFKPSPAQTEDLLQIYVRAVDNDPVLREAEARRDSALENKPQGIARLLPTISASAARDRSFIRNKKGGGDEKIPPECKDNPTLPGCTNPAAITQGGGEQWFFNNSLNLNLTQPVFHWDFWVQLSQADNLIAQAEADYQAAQQELMVRAAEAYFNVLSASDTLEFATSEKLAIARQLEQAKQRFEVGLIAITDVHEAQAAYDQARADEILAANDLDNAKEALREIIGEGDIELQPLGKQLPLAGPEPADIEEWSATAEKQNLSILSAQNQAEVARKTIEIQRSGHYPVVDLVASYGATDNTASFGLRGETKNLGVQVNVPLFAGGAALSRTRQAAHDFQAAKEQLVAAKRAALRQVRDAYRGVISTMSRAQALEAAVVSSESSLEATEAGFEVGTRTMVDVLAEQRDTFRAKRDLSRTRYDYIINGLKLKQAASNLMIEDIERVNGWLE